jgi:hypothetical protein
MEISLIQQLHAACGDAPFVRLAARRIEEETQKRRQAEARLARLKLDMEDMLQQERDAADVRVQEAEARAKEAEARAEQERQGRLEAEDRADRLRVEKQAAIDAGDYRREVAEDLRRRYE